MSKVRFVGLDVHADTIAVAVAETGGEVRSLGVIPNRLESIRKLIRKLGPVKDLRVCYEAGPTGYVVYWQLTQLGVECEVIAPSLVPTKAGDRVKTDRRDAEKLARCYRAGELTAVWVPDAAHEALRDLVRAREAAKKDQLKARHRLGKFLLRNGWRPEGLKAWTKQYVEWIKSQVRFAEPAREATLADYLEAVEQVGARILKLDKVIDQVVAQAAPEIRGVIEALQALRGVAQTTAATIVSELGSLSRFERPRELMGYSGLVASEHSSGNRVRRGGITKTGNSHLRRVLVEAAWAYRYRPNASRSMLSRQKNLVLSDEAKKVAWKAQQRLHNRYQALTARGKNKNQIMAALGRELLGFVWAIGVEAEKQHRPAQAA
jgi:transposase